MNRSGDGSACKDASNSNQAYEVINRREGRRRPAIATTGPPKNKKIQREVGEYSKDSKRIIKIYRANRVDDKKRDGKRFWRRMRRDVPKKRAMVTLKEMCKDRYVLICVSFSVLNAARA